MPPLVTALDIHNATFDSRLFGYDTTQVDRLLESAEHSISTLYAEIVRLRNQIRTLEGRTQ